MEADVLDVMNWVVILVAWLATIEVRLHFMRRKP